MPVPKTRAWAAFTICAAATWPTDARATPTTTYWAPSTTAVQPFLVPHLTYDTYFGRGPTAGQAGSPLYPIDTGLTLGVLPFKALNLEVGFDLLLPSSARAARECPSASTTRSTS